MNKNAFIELQGAINLALHHKEMLRKIFSQSTHDHRAVLGYRDKGKTNPSYNEYMLTIGAMLRLSLVQFNPNGMYWELSRQGNQIALLGPLVDVTAIVRNFPFTPEEISRAKEVSLQELSGKAAVEILHTIVRNPCGMTVEELCTVTGHGTSTVLTALSAGISIQAISASGCHFTPEFHGMLLSTRHDSPLNAR
jgi:hypothetical protein